MAKKRILIVDDDSELGEELAELLEAEGYFTERAADGRRGNELIRNNFYDIYLLDFRIEDMTGLDLLREIRSNGRQAAVFLVSGKPGLAAALEKAELAGAVDGIIEKPFTPQSLLGKLGSC